MAPTSKAGGASSAPGEAQPRASNGVLTSSNTPAGTINRKKAKRRQKQAAKQSAAREALGAEYADDDEDDEDYANGDLSTAHNHHPPPSDAGYNSSYSRGVLPSDAQYGYDNDDERVYSDEEGAYSYDGIRGASNTGTGKKSKRKKKNKNQQVAFSPPVGLPGSYPPPLPAPPPPAQMARPSISEEALRTVQRRATKDAIWDTSSQEERLRIKEFWLNLEEEKRKSLVKIEKEAVLRKMKEQQKHSCSCTVCGRKRTAIEEELEVLYDAYYEELEQFANHGQQSPENGVNPAPAPAMSYRNSTSRGPPDRGHIANRKFSGRRIEELADDDEDYLDDDRDEDGSDQASYDDEYASTNTDDLPPDNTPANDFFSFGKSLTVKGGILTVADDLLKNDGQKFIDMMEQLAERRMQREEDAAMASYRMPPPHQPMTGAHGTHPHAHLPPEEEDEYSDEEEDEEYDSQGEELEDDEDEMDTMTEEQRMEEGRRMFQIFAARMFEQRVLTAYREKVARDRQERLIAELDNEKDNDKERQAKKERDAQKKKLKKAQQKAAKDQKAQQKAEAEAKAKADEEERLAEQKRKREEQREEQRKKKDEERRKMEEEKARKEAEKQRRQMQERERQQEAERKAREVKAEEKRRKDEARQKERQAREAKEREAKERREQAEHGKRMKEERAKRDAAVQESTTTATAADATRRAPPAAKVALPPGLLPTSSLSPPQPKVATPVAPKAPTPVKPRDPAQPTGNGGGGRRSTTASSESSSKHSTPQKVPQLPLPPASNVSAPAISRAQLPPPLHPAPPPHPASLPFPHQPGMHAIAPAPGMPLPSSSSLPGFSPGPMSPFGAPSPMMGGMATRAFSGPQTGMFGPNSQQQQQQQQLQVQQQQQMNHRPGFGMPAPPGPPPGMGPPGMSRGYADGGPAPFVPHGPTVASGYAPGQQAGAVPGHSRQASGSSPIGPPLGAAAPIGRPGAIKPPASVKTNGEGDVDDLSTHLGSSALLADDDEPLPSPNDVSRPGAQLGMPAGRAGFGDTPLQPGFGSAFNHGVSGFGGLGPRMPAGDQSWAPRGAAPLQPPPNQFAAPTGLSGGAGGGHNGWGSAAAPGAGSGAAAAVGSGGGGGWGHAGSLNPSMHRASTSRPMIVRKLACEACHSLAAAKSGANGGYSELAEVLHHVQQARADLSIQRRELEDILDTEGDIDGHNGGGHFLRRGNMIAHVQPHGTRGPGGLGEIGSPMVGASVPMLPNLGRF